MLVLAHVIEIMLMLLIPLTLARWVHRQYGIRWALFGVGTLTYIAAEILSIGLNGGLEMLVEGGYIPFPTEPATLAITAAVVTGVIIALCQEPARWVVFRHWLKDRDLKSGLMVGLGHGGMEAILTALLVSIVMGTALALEGHTMEDLTALGLSGRTAIRVGLRVVTWWEGEPLTAILAALRQMLAMVCHLAASAWVLLAVAKQRASLLGVVILFHSIWAGGSAYANAQSGPVADVFFLGGCVFVACGMIAYASRGLAPTKSPE